MVAPPALASERDPVGVAVSGAHMQRWGGGLGALDESTGRMAGGLPVNSAAKVTVACQPAWPYVWASLGAFS